MAYNICFYSVLVRLGTAISPIYFVKPSLTVFCHVQSSFHLPRIQLGSATTVFLTFSTVIRTRGPLHRRYLAAFRASYGDEIQEPTWDLRSGLEPGFDVIGVVPTTQPIGQMMV